MYGASANQRLGVRNDALQGATLAFHSRDPSPVKVGSSITTPMADPLGHQRTGSDPAAGSVKDKVGRLARPLSPTPSTLSARGRPSAAPLSSASQIAARLAASRSPRRDTTPSTTARPGAGAVRNASRVPPSQEKRQPPPPIPVRSIRGTQSSLDRPLHQRALMSDSDLATYGRSSSQQSSTTLDYQDSRESSPHPSLESRNSSLLSDEPKPKLPPRVPPPRGSSKNHGVVSKLSPSTPSDVSLSSLSPTSITTIDDSIGMSEEALSNAIIASSIASTRASPSIRGSPRRFPNDDGSPSPPKSIPMTLRGLPKPTDVNHRRHRNPLHKHPHKHKEGDRKRWQREVLERERKRYEGVWASNKGLLINTEGPGPSKDGSWPPDASDMVLNLVVREIWSRSRLPETTLEQIWDLVDHQNIGLLVREEFVVGMWLIDQNLKGHKNPVRVRDSVWESVRHVGIKLPLARKGKGHT
ncbi:EPS15 homology (EH) [Penicillium coprophilum]|uniref:EPS15 homology (EH) n=1 Tax=Penicillium coprophilum TaxID=36646 RepID=UPI00239C2FB0|nr:EPS15 homology (EH) [Penicillium coprophilum]KAJ5177862.1 EPS15 homology (EH) [Penicillium coprophilum]